MFATPTDPTTHNGRSWYSNRLLHSCYLFTWISRYSNKSFTSSLYRSQKTNNNNKRSRFTTALVEKRGEGGGGGVIPFIFNLFLLEKITKNHKKRSVGGEQKQPTNTLLPGHAPRWFSWRHQRPSSRNFGGPDPGTSRGHIFCCRLPSRRARARGQEYPSDSRRHAGALNPMPGTECLWQKITCS